MSKQFTAAAVLLLARDGKLSLDDQVRKYVPELPDYGAPLTIRHMLNHTSGLRDWGSVAAIAGWPRTTRVHTHAHVLDIVSRQRALNFPSGTRYSYSNTGYNLAAIIVSRVSGQSFAEFTRARIFAPLGMTRTSWRDDYTRIVKDRAIAYSDWSGGFSTEMPFENVHGNGGLLTTVGDLLRWTRNFSQPVVGRRGVRQGRAGARTIQRRSPARLRARALRRDVPGRAGGVAQRRDGRLSRVALGLPRAEGGGGRALQRQQRQRDAVRARHRGHLSRLKRSRRQPCRRPTAIVDRAPGASAQDALTGMYRRTDTAEPLSVSRAGNELRVEDIPRLTARSVTRFTAANGVTVDFSADGLRVTDRFGTVDAYARVPADGARRQASRGLCRHLRQRRGGDDDDRRRRIRRPRAQAPARHDHPPDARLRRCVPRVHRVHSLPPGCWG